MSDSLRDQLLKAGLASREQARKTAHDKHRQKRDKRGPKRKRAADADSVSVADAAQAAQAERDRTLNRGREEGRRRKALDAQLWQIIEPAALNRVDADIQHHFQRRNRLTHIHVTAEQQARLGGGRLAIVGFHGRHYLIDLETMNKLARLDPKLFVFRHDPDAPDPDGDHPVPDDLVW